MIRNRKARRSGRNRPARLGIRPTIEAFEKRELLTAAPFLQGTAFIDTVGNGVRTPTEAPLAGATVSLYSGSTLVASTTTGADGGYLFDGSTIPALVPGNYTLVETPPTGYANTAAGGFSEIDPYSVTQPDTIQVTVEPATIAATYLSNLQPEVDAYYTVQSTAPGSAVYNAPATSITPSLISTADGSTTLDAQFPTYCVDAGHTFDYPPESFTASVLSQDSLPNGGQIAYLYNHYGTPGVTTGSFPASLSSNSLADLESGVQIAIWDLLYNNGAPAGTAAGGFNLGAPYGSTTTSELAVIQSIATTLVGDSAGQSEKVAVLNTSTNDSPSDPNTPHEGTQSVLAAQSFNFGNRPLAVPAINTTQLPLTAMVGTSIADKATVTGGANPTGTVTFNLYSNSTATGSPLFTDTETLSGGVATSAGYIATDTGTDYWVATYNGDTNNAPVSGGTADEPVTVATCQVTGISYTDVSVCGTTKTFTNLGGNTRQGDTVTVTFTTDTTEMLTLVSYNATSNFDLTKQTIYQVDTQTYGPGQHTLTVTIPDNYYQIDFVCGQAISTFNPSAGITFHGENRFIDSDNGGDQNPGTATVAGTVYIDATGNGLTGPSNAPLPGDVGESGVTVNLYNSANKLVGTSATDSNGNYAFVNLTPGTYSIQEVPPGGYVQTYPYAGTYTVNATATATCPVDNFSNFMAACNSATLTGVTYKVNGCTVPDLSGHTSEGATVSVTFTVPTGITETLSLVAYSAPDSSFSASTAGQQVIVGVQTGTFAAGQHTLTVTLPESYYQVDLVCGSPITQFGPANSNIFYHQEGRFIDSDNGGTEAVPSAFSAISGTVFADTNDSGVFTTGEAGIAGVTVHLTGTDINKQSVTLTRVTGADGSYSFGSLQPGTYTVTEGAVSGYISDVANTGSIANIKLAAGSGSTDNFGEVLPASISGVVFFDANGNGSYGGGDKGLAGVTLTLTGTVGGVAIKPVTATTGPDGSYSFGNLPPGSYTVTEGAVAGYQAGKNNGGSIAGIILSSGSTSTNDNFVEVAASCPLGCTQTASIDFWDGCNGQALIKSMNGGSNSTKLGNWLAAEFPHLFSSLAGLTNGQVASFYQSQYNQRYQTANAEVLATALAAYVTDSDLAGGTYATKYGFTVTTTGAGACTYNVGNGLACYGGPQGKVTLDQLFAFVDSVSCNGRIASNNWQLQYAINNLFDGINGCGI